MMEPLPVTVPGNAIGPSAAFALVPYSDESNGRPRSSVTPVIGKNSGLTLMPTSASGSLPPVIVNEVPPRAAIMSRDFARVRQSAMAGGEASSRSRFATTFDS
jgi:hypothetical protein